MRILFGGFRQEPTHESLEAYLIAIADLPVELIKVAVIKSIRQDKWMPKASELRESVKKLMPKERNPELQRILEDGRKRKPRLPMPAKAKTLRIEYVKQTQLSANELEARRSSFLKTLGEIE